MPRRKAGTSLPVARRATTIRWHTSFSACGGAEGSSRCAGMSLPYGSAAEGTLQPVGQAHAPPEGGDEPAGCSQSNTIRWHTSFSACGGAEGSSRCAGMSLPYKSAAEGMNRKNCKRALAPPAVFCYNSRIEKDNAPSL